MGDGKGGCMIPSSSFPSIESQCCRREISTAKTRIFMSRLCVNRNLARTACWAGTRSVSGHSYYSDPGLFTLIRGGECRAETGPRSEWWLFAPHLPIGRWAHLQPIVETFLGYSNWQPIASMHMGIQYDLATDFAAWGRFESTPCS